MSDDRTKPARPFRTLFLHDWLDVTMIHFEVDPQRLQPAVPFELDTYRGRAYVSLVLFRLQRMRLPLCPKLSRWLLRQLSDHRFLNVRTYVRHHDEAGIHFMAEWLDKRLAVLLGPLTYGLPYRLGRFDNHAVSSPTGRLTYQVTMGNTPLKTAEPGGLDAFLLERYSAFNLCRGRPRVFRIRHAPWRQRRIDAVITESSLISSFPWFSPAGVAAAHQSPGLVGVQISRPFTINRPLSQGALSCPSTTP